MRPCDNTEGGKAGRLRRKGAGGSAVSRVGRGGGFGGSANAIDDVAGVIPGGVGRARRDVPMLLELWVVGIGEVLGCVGRGRRDDEE